MSGLVCGSLGASRISDATAKTKTGYAASRANIMAELIAERLTGQPYDTYTNAIMQRGLEKEPLARSAYEFYSDCSVTLTEPIAHPKIAFAHASPDGLVDDAGLVEIKCPNTATHIETLLAQAAPEKYLKQMQWQMACTGRQWVDFVSYDDRMPEPMRMFVARVERDEKYIKELEQMVAEFLAEVAAKTKALTEKFAQKEAA